MKCPHGSADSNRKPIAWPIESEKAEDMDISLGILCTRFVSVY